MQEIKNMLFGIAIMVASIAFYSVYDNDTIAVMIAFIGLCIAIYGYSKKREITSHGSAISSCFLEFSGTARAKSGELT